MRRVRPSTSLARLGFAVDRAGRSRCTEGCGVAYRQIEVPMSLGAGIRDK
jgi:hypothetical protein